MTEKKDLIDALEQISVLMELKGENPFKVRAFLNAARILQARTEDLIVQIKNGDIIKIKGIGKGIADFLIEIVEKGHSEELERLKSEIPNSLLEMLKIPGMGPKKVKAIWDILNITSIGELEYACKENRLVDLDGFGIKTQDKILNGIELLKKYSDRHLLSKAYIESQNLLQALQKFPGVIRCNLAGSLRRWKETIKDIDFVVSAADEKRKTIMDFFTKLPSVEAVHGQGLTKSTVMLKSGINADLRIVGDEQFPYALHHSTGSKEHNVAMREYARKLKLKMNEYGLFKENGENVQCKDENEIFQNLNMVYVPPEMRENYGEIDAALHNRIPNLVSLSDIRGIIHVHTQYSDGSNTIKELVSHCLNSGFEYLVICDHSKAAAYANGLTEEKIEQQQREIEALNSQIEEFRIFKSIECDILGDGSLDYHNDILSTFDLVIASIHSRFNMSQQEATSRMIKAMENPYVTIIGHPTGRLLLAREGYPIDMQAIIQAAADLQVVIELNANPHRLDIDWRLLKSVREKGVKISINPDAHRIEGIGDIQYGVGIARKGWLTPADVLNCYSAADLTKFVKARRSISS
jgi:DNA polymerase (family 10)